MEKLSPINSFIPPFCRIHNSDENTLMKICFHEGCANKFKAVCIDCVVDPEIHNHNQKGISYKSIKKTLEDIEKLAAADIPSNISLMSDESGFKMSYNAQNEIKNYSQQQ